MRVRALILDQSGRILLGLNQEGLYGLPGGKVKEGEHPVDALLREIREETGMFEFENLEYLYEQHDNKVFLFVPKQMAEPPSSKHDPDQEFTRLQWFDMNGLPELEEFSEDIVYRFMRKIIEDESLDKPPLCIEGRIDVMVDGKKVYELDDDEIWETLPRLAQERSKGKKVEFKQILEDGTVIDQTPNAMPDFIQVRKAEGMEDSMDMGTWINEKTAPDVELKEQITKDIMSDLTFKVYVDGEHYKTCHSADEIESLIQSELIEKRSNGHKVKYVQVLDDGEEIDLTPQAIPKYFREFRKAVQSSGNWERSTQTDKIHTLIDELLTTYIPEESNRPTVEIVYDVHYLGKTVWREHADANATHIVVNHNILKNEELLRQVLAHEIIHHHLYQQYGNDVAKHGEHFDYFAAKINQHEGENYITEFANDTEFKHEK